ncbi:MAG: trypsin-like peptidase domain-containing protein [Parvularculaceae bacterium]
MGKLFGQKLNTWVAGYAIGVSTAFALLAAIVGGGQSPLSGIRNILPAAQSDVLLTFDARDFGQARATGGQQDTFDGHYRLQREKSPASYEDITRFPEGFPWRRFERSVGQIDVCFRDKVKRTFHAGSCTASIISPSHLLTARHCVFPGDYADKAKNWEARYAVFLLGFVAGETAVDPSKFRVDIREPVEAGERERKLDFAVLEADFAAPLKNVGGCEQENLKAEFDEIAAPVDIEPVTLADYRPERGEPLFLVHHPIKTPLVVTSYNCRAEAGVSEDGSSEAATQLQHKCDTLPGSSGAPVFSFERNAVVAVHRAGIASGWTTNSATYVSDIAAFSRSKGGVIASLVEPGPLKVSDRESAQKYVTASVDAFGAGQFALAEAFALAAFPPDARQASSTAHGATDAQAALIRAHRRNLRTAAIRDNEFPFKGFVWSPDGSQIATISKSGDIKLWSADTAEFQKTLFAAPPGSDGRSIRYYLGRSNRDLRWTAACSGADSQPACTDLLAAFDGRTLRIFNLADASRTDIPWTDGDLVDFAWRGAELRFLASLETDADIDDEQTDSPPEFPVHVGRVVANRAETLLTIEGAHAPRLSPDGARLAFGNTTQLIIRELDSGKQREILHKGRIDEILWSDDSMGIIFSENGESKHLDLGSGDGKALALGAELGRMGLSIAAWDKGRAPPNLLVAKDPFEIGLFNVFGVGTDQIGKPDKGYLTDVQWSPSRDARRFATLTDNDQIDVWYEGSAPLIGKVYLEGYTASDSTKPGALPPWRSPTVLLTAAAFSQDGEKLLAGFSDGRIALFETASGGLLQELTSGKTASKSLACECYYEALALSDSGTDADAAGRDLKLVSCRERFGAEGARAFEAGRTARRAPSVDTARCAGSTPDGPGARVAALGWVPSDADAFYSASSGGEIRVWDISTIEKPLARLLSAPRRRDGPYPARVFKISPDGQLLASFSPLSLALSIINVRSGDVIEISGEPESSGSSPLQPEILSVIDRPTRAGDPLSPPVTAIEWSISGHLLAGTKDGFIRVLDFFDGKSTELRKIDVGRGSINGLGATSGGARVIVSTADGLSYWNLLTNAEVEHRPIRGNQPLYKPLYTEYLHSPNGALVALGSYGFGGLPIIDVETGEEMMAMPPSSSIDTAWSPQSDAIRTVSSSGVLEIWSTPSTGLELRKGSEQRLKKLGLWPTDTKLCNRYYAPCRNESE